LAQFFRSFDRVLRTDGKSDRTRKMYHDRAASLDAWLDRLPSADRSGAPGAPDPLTAPQAPADVTSRHIEAYIDSVAARTSQATASNHYRALQQFFKFLLLEAEISADPFAELSPPKVASKPLCPRFQTTRSAGCLPSAMADADFDYNFLHATDARGKRRPVFFGAGTRRALES
jgi:hypothetical protein